MKRVRFGIKLSWPIVNGATFVRKCKADDALKIEKAIQTLRGALLVAGMADIADRIICEIE